MPSVMLDDRDLVADGFQCQDCGTPFDDGVGHPRSCRACGGVDESRHDQFQANLSTMKGLDMTPHETLLANLDAIQGGIEALQDELRRRDLRIEELTMENDALRHQLGDAMNAKARSVADGP
jgi:hypothetical protein